MKKGLFIREYKGFYTVDFSNKSVGMTLFATWNKEEAEKELSRLKSLDKKQFIKEVTQ
jgi:hypothetical protein